MQESRVSPVNATSIAVNFPISTFDIKRRSHPASAFAELMEYFNSAQRGGSEIGRAFDYLLGRFKGVAVKREHSVRLAELRKQGISASEFAVGSLPSAMGPGLALMYDAGLEVLRSSDRQILTELSDARVIRAVARSMDQVLPLIGAASVTAVELALDDPAFRERLKARAGELTTSYVQNWPSGNCEFCEITIQDSDGTVETRCGTEDECRAAGGIIVVLIGVLILKWLWDQIF